MMLPQFGYIVAQAGADSHNLPGSTTPVPQVSATAAAVVSVSANNSISSLAPLLNNSGSGNSANSTSKPSSALFNRKYNHSPVITPNKSSVDYYNYYNNSNSNSASTTSTTTAAAVAVLPQPLFSLQQTPPNDTPNKSSFLYQQQQQPKKENVTTDNSRKPWFHNTTATTSNNNNNNNNNNSKPYYQQQHQHQQQHSPSPMVVHEERRPSSYQEEIIEQQNQSTAKYKEYNDLMTWMDNEFWERADEIYQEKLLDLQQELINIQKDTHSAFKEILADFESKREKTIGEAEYFQNYQIAFIEHYFDQDVNSLEDEYENEKRHIQDTLITSIEDKRRQLKDSHSDESNEVEEQTNRSASKRNLRKRNADNSNVTRVAEPLSKRRSTRPSAPPNIHTISLLEEEELENEFLTMKSAATKSF